MYRALLTSALLTLAACGGGEEKPSAPPPTPPAPAGQTATAPPPVAPAGGATAEPTASAGAKPARSGPDVYAQICATCHQANGQGLPGAFPPLVGSEWANGKPETPIRVVLHGLQGEIEVNGQKYNSVMTPQKDMLSDEEIANVLTYVRSSWGNTGAPVTADQVKALREQHKDRTTPWTVAELQGG